MVSGYWIKTQLSDSVSVTLMETVCQMRIINRHRRTAPNETNKIHPQWFRTETELCPQWLTRNLESFEFLNLKEKTKIN